MGGEHYVVQVGAGGGGRRAVWGRPRAHVLARHETRHATHRCHLHSRYLSSAPCPGCWLCGTCLFILHSFFFTLLHILEKKYLYLVITLYVYRMSCFLLISLLLVLVFLFTKLRLHVCTVMAMFMRDRLIQTGIISMSLSGFQLYFFHVPSTSVVTPSNTTTVATTLKPAIPENLKHVEKTKLTESPPDKQEKTETQGNASKIPTENTNGVESVDIPVKATTSDKPSSDKASETAQHARREVTGIGLGEETGNQVGTN